MKVSKEKLDAEKYYNWCDECKKDNIQEGVIIKGNFVGDLMLCKTCFNKLKKLMQKIEI